MQHGKVEKRGIFLVIVLRQDSLACSRQVQSQLGRQHAFRELCERWVVQKSYVIEAGLLRQVRTPGTIAKRAGQLEPRATIVQKAHNVQTWAAIRLTPTAA